MTREQFEQWRDFAVRMAKVAFAGAKRPSPEWILEKVESFLGLVDDDREVEAIRDWDNSDKDEATGYYYECVSDRFSSFEDDSLERPNLEYLLEEKHDDRWSGVPYDEIPKSAWHDLEDRIERAREAWRYQWSSPVACCVRAGLDMATRIGGGVVGFDVGMLRQMYPEGIPAFVQRHYADDLAACPADEPIWL